MKVPRVKLGRRGPLVPVVFLGAWQAGGRMWGRLDREEYFRAVNRAVELGLLGFDTAEIYGAGASEKLLGEALRRSGALEEAFIVTKVAGFRVTVSGVLKAVEGSSRRLGRRPDLVLYHWPPPLPFTACRAARLLEEARRRRLTGYIGVSNFDHAELEEAASCAEVVADQVHYSLAHRVPENHLLPTTHRLGVAVMAWGPLAKGALAGKTRPDNLARATDPVFMRAARDGVLQEALASVAERHGVSKAVVALAWLISKGALPVVGFRKRSHVEAAAQAASLHLGADDMKLLDEASARYRGRPCTRYRELHWNRFIPPPVQWLMYRLPGI